MGAIRKPLQGVTNIIRFNWHFYVIALAIVSLLIVVDGLFDNVLQAYIYIVCALVTGSIIISYWCQCMCMTFRGFTV
jgi:hypothetical protein